MATVKVTPCTLPTPENQRLFRSSSVNPNSRVSLSLPTNRSPKLNRLVSHSSSPLIKKNPQIVTNKLSYNGGGGSGGGGSGRSGGGDEGSDENDGKSIKPVQSAWFNFKEGFHEGFFGSFAPNSLIPTAETLMASGLFGVIGWIVDVKTGCISGCRNRVD